MPLSVAEYLGQRTDVLSPDIIPTTIGEGTTPTCPFSGVSCSKLASKNPKPPICTVRVTDKNDASKPFIVCSDRLIPAKARALSPAHIAALASVTGVLFPSISTSDIGYRRQVGLSLSKHRLVLDYVLQVNPQVYFGLGPSKVILEVQGGGETNSTGVITRHVERWAKSSYPTNQILAQQLSVEYIRQVEPQPKITLPNIIPNNAWKRQLDQIIKKATLTRHFEGAFALVMGDVLYDYVKNSISIGKEYFAEWEIAFIGISERPTKEAGALPFDQVAKVAFMTYAEFMIALQDVKLLPSTPNPFLGEFTTLRNRKFIVA